MNEIQYKLGELLTKAWKDLEKAAQDKNAPAVASCHRLIAELEEMRKTLENFTARLATIEGASAGSQPNGACELRRLRIRVTQGMLNQNLLTLTNALRQGMVRPRERFSVSTSPGNEKFQTDLVGVGNKLRERGAIGRFYRETGTKAGDVVEMVETAPGEWLLRKAAP